ncbi:MAG: hypothetical protein ABIY70_23820 [Capsulimonas sp.]|uniref:hypothetical protein n=1 Tax=Capsulimonas sp. TaxID=2494211 RepID=UPI003265F12F
MTQQELDQRFSSAEELKEKGKYLEALTEYLDLLDNYRNPRIFGPAHLISALSGIIEIAKHIQEAREALLVRRSQWEEMVLSGSGGYQEMSDIHLMNDLMEHPEQNLVFLTRLANLGPSHQDAYNRFLKMVWKELASAGRFTELEPCIEKQTSFILCQIAQHHVMWDFAEDAEKGEESQGMLEYLLPDAILIYEALLALGKDDIASKLAKWVFECEPLAEAPPQFITAANKMGRTDTADALTRALDSRSFFPKSGNAGAVSPVPNSGDHSQVFEGDTP